MQSVWGCWRDGNTKLVALQDGVYLSWGGKGGLTVGKCA